MFIGEKLHALRRAKDLTLVELSEQSGVQLATLSRIENKKMVGTLESHIQIAKALGIDVTDLYKGITREGSPIEVGGQKSTEVFSHSSESSYDILTKNLLHKKMMPTLIRIEPDGKTNTEQHQGGSEKFIFVLDGHVQVTIDKQPFDLRKNNTLYFDASLPHVFKNMGKSTAKVICVATPVML